MIQEYKYSFDFDIKDIRHSIASSDNIKSPTHTFDDCEWRLEVKISGSLEVYLECLTTKRRSRRVPTAFKVSVMKQDASVGTSASRNQVYGIDFIPLTLGSGFNEMLPKDVLLNPTAGYIINNNIRVKVHINPLNAKYGDPSLDDSFWAPFNGIDKDLTLIVGGQEIAVHRFILAKGCHYFRFLLYPIQGKEITLDDCDYNATLTLIRFIYTYECVIHPNNLRNVLLIGKKFGLKWLLLSCFELLSPQNAALFASVINAVSRNYDGDDDDDNEDDDDNDDDDDDDGDDNDDDDDNNDLLEGYFWQFIGKHVSTVLSSDDLWNLTDDEILSFILKKQVTSQATAGQFKSVVEKVSKRQNKTVNQVTIETTPEASSSSLLCVVCKVNTVDTMVIPCNHLCLCSRDADTLRRMNQKCPLCQRQIQSLTRVYLP